MSFELEIFTSLGPDDQADYIRRFNEDRRRLEKQVETVNQEKQALKLQLEDHKELEEL